MHRSLCSLLILTAACGDAAPPASAPTVLSDSLIAALPALTASPGSLVCTALGVDGCPLRGALANRLDDGRIALWEPGFTVYTFAPGDTIGTPIGSAGTGGQYLHVAATTELARDRYQLILIGQEWRAIEINAAGEVSRTDTLPNPGLLTAIGYVGKRLVRQRMHTDAGSGAGRFIVTLLDEVTDTSGTTLLDVPLPWYRAAGNGPPPGALDRLCTHMVAHERGRCSLVARRSAHDRTQDSIG